MTELERENIVSWQSVDVQELHYPEDTQMQQPMKERQEDEEAEADGGECDYLVFEIGEKEERKSDGEKMEKGAEEEGDDETGRSGDVGRKEEGERENAGENIVGDPWKDDNRGEGKDEDGGMKGRMEADAAVEPLFLSAGPSSSSPPEQLMESGHPEKLAHQDEPDTCLQAQFALVSSDSELGDEQWAAFAASEVTQRDEGAVEEERREDEEREEPEESKVVDEDEEDGMRSRSGVFLRSPSFSSTASSTDPDRRVRPVAAAA